MADQPVRYRRAIADAAPTITALFLLCLVGYYYVRTWWWIVVFAFGALAVFSNRVYYQKSIQLREQLNDR
ncbi:hypothetical protein [Natrialbaceae archaeon AArc-T1-2]|uniref:hypothetical protein n=1 Tax=Natrialbaceae archaeon AArc-T1-2 TaxID=3053904 RepID=UPI00255B2C47|nr:hypothetical protein [Natrialbaceae archaeon AArc-T1-2]WIV68268.1 hypothetical protein QQ977_05950 [Natrialbaceae archaeon AArc-T1-2]